MARLIGEIVLFGVCWIGLIWLLKNVSFKKPDDNKKE